MALLSSGCRATVEGLPNVQNSSTTQQWQSYLAGWQLHVPCRQNSKHFHFRSIKSYSVIPLFRIPRFTASPIYPIQGPVVATYTTTNTSQTEFIQTGLQCAASYYIRVVVTGEIRLTNGSSVTAMLSGTSDVRFSLEGKEIVCMHEISITVANLMVVIYAASQQYQSYLE